MSPRAAQLLAWYLICISIVVGYLICTLWSSHPIAAPGQTRSNSAPGFAVYPDKLDVGTAQNVLLVGIFEDNTKVKVNNIDHNPIVADRNHLLLPLSANDVSALGSLVISLSKADGSGLGSQVLSVVPAQFHWKLLVFGPFPIDKEAQLLLLILFVGTLSSSVYTLKSLADYRGSGRLYQSWNLYYLIQPLEGAGVAFVFYVLIRAGFLTATNNDAQSVNQFGMCAIAALAGTFSDLAFMKLREVFQTMFRPQDSRGGKVDAVKITATSLPPGTAGQSYKQVIMTSGGHSPFTWSISPQPPAGLTFQNGEISGTPSAAMSATSYTFIVKDSAQPPTSDTIALDFIVH